MKKIIPGIIFLFIYAFSFSQTVVDTTICQGDSVCIGEVCYKETGNFNITLTSSTGTDSLVNLILNVAPLPVFNLGQDTSFCAGNSMLLNIFQPHSTYLWKKNLDTLTTTDTTGTLSVSQTGNYLVQMTDSNFCKNKDSIFVNILPLPVVHLGNDTSFCAGDTVFLNATLLNATYIWRKTNDSTILSDTSGIFPVTLAGNYFVQVTDSNFCQNRDTVSVNIRPLPMFNLGNDTAVCEGNSIFLETHIEDAIFLWQDSSAANSLSVNQTGTYWVRVTNFDNCTATDTFHLVVNSLPVVNLRNDTAICQGDSLLLDAQNPEATYFWNTYQTSQQIYAVISGKYKVTVTNSFQCQSSDSVFVTVNELPSINLGRDSLYICRGDSILLDAQNVGSSYFWSTQQTSQQIYVFDSGKYIVTVTNSFNCQNSDSSEIFVNELPAVNLGNDTSICEGDTIFLDAKNEKATILWSTNEISQKISVSAAGIYAVSVTDSNLCVNRDTINVVVNPIPVFSLGEDISLCQNDSAILHSPDSCDSYLWQNGSTDTFFIAKTPTTYILEITKKGCKYSDSLVARAISLPNVTAMSEGRSVCKNSSTMLFVNSENATSFQWFHEGQPIFTDDTLRLTSVTESDSGFYYCVVANSCGSGYTDSIKVSMKKPPVVTPLDFSLVNLCELSDTTILATVNGEATTQRWFFGDSTFSTSNSLVLTNISIKNGGKYSFAAQNDCGSDSTSFLLTIHSNPKINLGKDFSFCEGMDTSLNVTSNFSSYSWSTGETTQKISISESGIYSVLVTNSNGCKGGDTISVNTNSAPQIVSIDTTIRFEITIQAAGTEPLKYSLNDGKFGSQTTFSKLNPGIYIITVKDSIGCKVKTDEIKIQDIFIPSAFTPNGDGVNENFYIEAIDDYPEAEISIFDRHNKLIIKYKGNETPWNGTFGGKELESNTYWYFIDLKDGSKPRVGHITLKR